MVALIRSGRTPESLSRAFEPTAQTIRNWVKQVNLDAGRRTDGLTTAESEDPRDFAGRTLVEGQLDPFETDFETPLESGHGA